MTKATLAALVVLSACARHPADETELRAALERGGDIVLPAGTVTIDRPLVIPDGAEDLTLRGRAAGSTITLSAGFSGKAAIVARRAHRLRLAGFSIAGNRGEPTPTDVYLPPTDVSFADHYRDNGILLVNGTDLTIEDVRLSRIRGFAVLVSASRQVRIERAAVSESGALNKLVRNNTTGGILLEEGTRDFVVAGCDLAHVAGNGIWTHSNYTSERNGPGVIRDNNIVEVARDAIQVGHATRVEVSRNRGSRIGYPVEWVDLEGQGTPVAIDTAGNVDQTHYVDNRFEDVNGRCFDLDGFHDGSVSRNSCINSRPWADYPLSTFAVIFNNANPDMTSQAVDLSHNLFQGFAYGGAYVIGSGHRIVENSFVDVNRARCTTDVSKPPCHYAPKEPGALSTGIYLTTTAERPAITRNNEVRNNIVTGFGMSKRCIGAGPGVDLRQNVVAGNVCEEGGQ